MISNRLRLEDLKEGYLLPGYRFDSHEKIIEIEDLEDNWVVFRTLEINKGFTISEFCGNKEGEFLDNIHPTSEREAIKHYYWGARSQWPREQIGR